MHSHLSLLVHQIYYDTVTEGMRDQIHSLKLHIMQPVVHFKYLLCASLNASDRIRSKIRNASELLNTASFEKGSNVSV